MGKRLILLLSLLFLSSGCAHIISEKSLEKADRSVEFSKLRQEPDAFRGRFVILGGAIAAVRPGRDGTELEVVQYPLDSMEMPETTDESEGRFLVALPAEHGFGTFKPGMVVTMAGEVVGKAKRPLAGAEYGYPVIVVREIHIIVLPPGRRGYGGY